jgi:hypothetical protein
MFTWALGGNEKEAIAEFARHRSQRTARLQGKDETRILPNTYAESSDWFRGPQFANPWSRRLARGTWQRGGRAASWVC